MSPRVDRRRKKIETKNVIRFDKGVSTEGDDAIDHMGSKLNVLWTRWFCLFTRELSDDGDGHRPITASIAGRVQARYRIRTD